MRYLETVMGVPMSLDLRDPDDDRSRAAARSAFDLLRAEDARFSPFRADSELRRYERGLVDAPSPELAEVLSIAAGVQAASAGAFDIRRPGGGLDANGVVKGWAVQRAVELLRAEGFGDLCFNAGGDVVVVGGPEPGRSWAVGVRSPLVPDELVARVEVREGAVATSGTYERGQHVWDGRTGRAADGLLAATVVAGDLTTADVLATSVLALGPDGVEWALGQGAAWVLAVRPDGTLVSGDAGQRPAA
ncbi:FAD:protein FMN transferase [Promicromonospora sp. NPDC050262]|uniref:FAD:protein FMN transferase n=1 Tax=Promicromonospora sp. NPDC050262 TaxID=3155036 RepID=UPI0033EC2153